MLLDLCGTEVLPDYPHNEVRNVGLNHFPNGVFQICRVIVQKNMNDELDKIRKSKRISRNLSRTVLPLATDDESINGRWDNSSVRSYSSAGSVNSARSNASPSRVRLIVSSPH